MPEPHCRFDFPPVYQGEHVSCWECHCEARSPSWITIVDLVRAHERLVGIIWHLRSLLDEDPQVGRVADAELLHHLGFEHIVLLCVQLEQGTQWHGYKENPTVLDRVPMSTEGKLGRMKEFNSVEFPSRWKTIKWAFQSWHFCPPLWASYWALGTSKSNHQNVETNSARGWGTHENE